MYIPMKTSSFFFELPRELIAQYPPKQRGQSRLMLLNRRTGKRSHRMTVELPEILCGNDFYSKAGPPLLVFNNSKVRKARLIGKSLQTGGMMEFLLLECIDANSFLWKALAKHARRQRPGNSYAFFDKNENGVASATIKEREGGYSCGIYNGQCILEFNVPISDDWLERYGHVPLPPYIKRKDTTADAECYQTVYASETGSSAAPTAGLHFTSEDIDRLCAAGIETAFLTLHVGLGTFLPVRCENVQDHVMHSERFSIDEKTAAKIEAAKSAGRKIVAVGTTSVRTLESAWNLNCFKRGEGST